MKFTKMKLARLTSLLLWGSCFTILAATSTASAQAQELSSELQQLLQAPVEQPYKWFASTDPKHQNNDYILLKPGETRRVPLAKGALERLWSTATVPEGLQLQLQNGPGAPLTLLDKGKAAVGQLRNKAYTLFPQITFEAVSKMRDNATLIATNRSNAPSKWYYQVSIRPEANSPLPLLPKVTGISKQEFNMTLAPGEDKSISSWDKPGMIYELQVAVTDGSAKGVFENLHLEADWDGGRGVDAPLMALAGQVAGTEFVQNVVADYDGARILLRWPMPFNTATLRLKNNNKQSLKLNILARVQSFDTVPSEYRFCAVENSAQTVMGKPVSILDVKGSGAFAGLALSIAPTADSPKRTYAYLEGNESLIADGKTYEGTGTEDYFSSAWYFPEKPALNPYDGLTFKSANPPSVSAYRFHLSDAIPFKNSLRFDFEQGKGNNSNDLIWTWTAFWYQKPPLANPSNPNEGQGATPASGLDVVDAPHVASGDKWKLWAAVAVGVLLGIISAFLKIRRRRRS